MAKRLRKTLDQVSSAPTISSRVISIPVKRNDVSRQIDYKSPFDEYVGDGSGVLLPPPYNPERVSTVIEQSNILPQCIDCMVTNIAMYGYETVPAPGYNEHTIDLKELSLLDSFITQANTVQSMMEVAEARTRDYERIGYSYLEVIRNRTGKVTMVKHAPSFSTRMTGRTSDPQVITERLKRGDTYIEVKTIKRFRKFVQMNGNLKVYFKEFGDPRDMDYRTGEYATAEKPVPKDMRATEILHEKQTSDDPYGVPRWISQLPGILGSRESEEVNLRYFEDNTVPPMIISVSGGRLTAQSFRNLEDLLQRRAIGKDRQHKILLLEAIAESVDLEGNSHVSFKIDKLADARQSDGLFSEYDKFNSDKVRSAFRLPPVLIGSAENHTYACYSEDTETLTDHGWVTVDEFVPGMKIATVNPESGALEFHYPEGDLPLVYEVENESLYHISNRGVDILVTPNHRMCYRKVSGSQYSVQPIEEMVKDGDRLMFRSAAISYIGGEDKTHFHVPENNFAYEALNAKQVADVPMDLFLEFLGYAVADGSTVRRDDLNIVRIGASKAYKVDAFDAVIDRMEEQGFRVQRSKPSAVGQYSFSVVHKGFRDWFRDTCGTSSKTKRLPEWFRELPAHRLQILFDALMLCDGYFDSRDGRSSGTYSTVSEVLASQVQEAAILLGYRAAISVGKVGGYADSAAPLYRVNISSKQESSVRVDKDIERVSYTGRVYCFSVPNGVFVTRRNGKVAIQGNTANTSSFIAEMQVFLPERMKHDAFLNANLINHPAGLGLKTVQLKSKAPPLTNPEKLVQAFTAFNVMGAITPRDSVDLCNDVTQVKLAQYPEEGEEGYEPWMDQPAYLLGRSKGGESERDNDSQSRKTPDIKEVEEDGDITTKNPEHGQE